jgi:hypothetical protein
VARIRLRRIAPKAVRIERSEIARQHIKNIFKFAQQLSLLVLYIYQPQVFEMQMMFQ